MAKIEIVDYRPEWALAFQDLKQVFTTQFAGLIQGVEHVGSTAVVGLAAKPILDIDLLINDTTLLPQLVAKTATLGYRYQGDLGIPDRYAFQAPTDGELMKRKQWLPHHLYACVIGSASLTNHLVVRAALRQDPALVQAYADLKRHLAARYGDDMEAYVAGKSNFISQLLRTSGMAQAAINEIARQNRVGGKGGVAQPGNLGEAP